jgi:hypothetical protein
LQTCPESAWYADRCQLLQRFFGHLTGHEIRAIQYREYEYSTASYKDLIPRIEEKVRENFEAFFGPKFGSKRWQHAQEPPTFGKN